ncbi:ATP-binding protein [Actinokineospora fastidiosa]|uniref:LuxR family transcriptional regulator n=1 Tax=Actinokineospora fastidiosa TaxID=1816 RepID=A0A918GFU7_9PSEU|nr:LuxR family transcriptional regulator [Actinokineospora fastidiosa]GGS33230.1 LuxR family transcriptional regulator [Actinokineospora fastidiosa]
MSAPVLGRRPEQARLDRWLDDARAGRGRAALIEGEPGIGKTVLVRAACDRAERSGMTVSWGACDELGQRLPLLPWLDALRVRDGGGERRAAVNRLLRGEAPVGADPVTAAAEHLVALVGEAGPAVVVLDDLQWADRATVALWCALARRAADLPLLLLGTARDVPRRAELAAVRRATSAQSRLRLARLTEREARDLVGALAGGPPGPRLLAMAEEAAGNPLYLTELVDALRRDGVVAVADGVAEVTGDPAPGSLDAAIAHRLDFLPADVRAVLRAAALLGVEFALADVAVVLDTRVAALVTAVDHALAAGVLCGSGPELRFRHPLIHRVIYDGMPAGLRGAWHEEAARALAAAGAPVERVARQFLRGVHRPHGWAADWLATAAPALIAQAPAVAIDLLQRAVDAGAPLAGRLADALYRTGERARAEAVAARALEASTDPDETADLHWTLAQCRALDGRGAESLATLADALARPGLDGRHRARLLVLSARAHRDIGEVDRAGEVARSALACAEEAGDRWAVGWALHVLTVVAVMRGEMAAALPLFERALAVTGADPALLDLRMLLQINQAVALGDLDRYPEAIAAAEQVKALAEGTGALVRLAQAHSALAELRHDTGRWDDALAGVAAVPAEAKDPGVACCDHGTAAVILLRRGNPEAAARHLAAAEAPALRIGSRTIAALALARSLARECAGDPAGALAVLVASLSGGGEEAEEMEDLIPDAVRLAVQLDDRGTATFAAGMAEKLAQDCAIPHRAAAAAYCRGVLAADPAELMAAAERYHAAGRPFGRARALHQAAVAFAGLGEATEARTAFTQADDLYAGLGATWDAARLRAALRGHGIRRGPRAQHRRARTGWPSLTPTEGRVAALVAAGLSNPQIADRLVLSRRTVATHVSHILAKLGVASRTDIAREATRRYRESG